MPLVYHNLGRTYTSQSQSPTKWLHSEEFMCHLWNIAMRDYQESVTTGQTHTDRQTDRQTPDKVIPMCRYASQATQKAWCSRYNMYNVPNHNNTILCPLQVALNSLESRVSKLQQVHCLYPYIANTIETRYIRSIYKIPPNSYREDILRSIP